MDPSTEVKMLEWSLVVGFVRALVFAAAHVCGNSVGCGILAVSLLVRLALLPLTLRAARRGMAHQARLAELKPALDRLQADHANDRAALAEATLRLHREHGLGMLPRGTVAAALIQLPIGAALYQAFAKGLGPRLGFLWIGDLARPDAMLVGLAAALAGLTAGLGTTSNSRTAVAVSAALTLVIAWRLTASVALYWIASSSVGAVQALVLRRSPTLPQVV
jgi:YidC/Oxa1 family membrane protein insertase